MRIEWIFWLSTVLLGGGAGAHSPDEWMEVGVWVAVVLVSILIHELGHALTGEHFGARPFIILHGLGGLTSLPGPAFSRRAGLAVCAAGPAASLLLGAVVLGFSKIVPEDFPWLRLAAHFGLEVNFFWTLVNLLPIQPLDGGQILRLILGPSRARWTGLIGTAVAVWLAVWAWQHGRIFLMVFLAVLAIQNFQTTPRAGGVSVETKPKDVP